MKYWVILVILNCVAASGYAKTEKPKLAGHTEKAELDNPDEYQKPLAASRHYNVPRDKFDWFNSESEDADSIIPSDLMQEMLENGEFQVINDRKQLNSPSHYYNDEYRHEPYLDRDIRLPLYGKGDLQIRNDRKRMNLPSHYYNDIPNNKYIHGPHLNRKKKLSRYGKPIPGTNEYPIRYSKNIMPDYNNRDVSQSSMSATIRVLCSNPVFAELNPLCEVINQSEFINENQRTHLLDTHNPLFIAGQQSIASNTPFIEVVGDPVRRTLYVPVKRFNKIKRSSFEEADY